MERVCLCTHALHSQGHPPVVQKHALASSRSRTATRKGAERTRHGARAAALTSPADAAANQDASGTRGGERSFSKTVAADSGAVDGPSGMFSATVSSGPSRRGLLRLFPLSTLQFACGMPKNAVFKVPESGVTPGFCFKIPKYYQDGTKH